MPIEDYLQVTLVRLEQLYSEMQSATGNVHFRNIGAHRQFRHETLSESLVCFLKGVKAVSTLNACLILLRHGHTQEIGALCRMVDDLCNEIFYLLIPQGDGTFSKDQLNFVETFFQEEFDRPDDPLGSTQKRDTVPVRKIHATFAKLASAELNPSDAQELLRTAHQALSGYVHGAYPHIMEMFGGDPPTFHMSGMLGTPRVDESRRQLVGYVHRLVMATVFVVRKVGRDDLETPIRALLDEFEATTGTRSDLTAIKLLAKYKGSRGAA